MVLTYSQSLPSHSISAIIPLHYRAMSISPNILTFDWLRGQVGKLVNTQ